MCYSARCTFEDYMGNCTFGMDYQKFKEKYGYSACLIGGHGDTPEEEEWIGEHRKELDDAYQNFLEDNRVEREKFWKSTTTK